MRISDWSSDVCSSDLLLSKLLLRELFVACLFEIIVIAAGLRAIVGDLIDLFVDALALAFPAGSAFAGGFVGLLRLGSDAHLHSLVVRLFDQIARASCRERVCLVV